MSDEMREAFERILRESGRVVGPFLPDVGYGVYAHPSDQTDYARMLAMHQFATAAADAKYREVIEKAVEWKNARDAALENVNDETMTRLGIAEMNLAIAATVMKGGK